jgi:hypothetical protein
MNSVSLCVAFRNLLLSSKTYVLNYQFMSYILNILISIYMIMLDSMLQCLLFITVIDLFSTFDNTIVLIYSLLFQSTIYYSCL